MNDGDNRPIRARQPTGLRPPTASGPAGAAGVALTAFVCLTGLLAGGCLDHLPLTGGQTLSHRYRGVADDDVGVTPRSAQAADAGPTAAASPTPPADRRAPGNGLALVRPPAPSPAPEARPADPEPAPRPADVPRDADVVWGRRPVGSSAPAPEAAAPDDPFGEPGGSSRLVNVFGEIEGQPAPKPGAAGEAGFQQHTFTDEGADADVCVDPTGKWLLYASTRHSEHSDIYLQRTDGTSVIQLTAETAGAAYPCFSPDGKQIAFASTRSGPWQIYLMDTDGRNVVQVTNGTMQCIHPGFSPDGTRLVYCAIGSRSNQWELWTANLTTNEKRMVGYGLMPRWSPDKAVDRIAFQRARQRGGRWFSLWTLDLIEGEGRRLTEVAASANAAVVSPCWSPDGRRLSFSTIVEPAAGAGPADPGRGSRRAKSGERAKAAPARRGRQDVWTIGADGGNRQRLTDGNGTNLSPWWATDGRVYFISDRAGNECVWSVKADAVKTPAGPSAAPGTGVAGGGPNKDAAADAGEPER